MELEMDDLNRDAMSIATFALVQGLIATLFRGKTITGEDITTIYSVMSEGLSKQVYDDPWAADAAVRLLASRLLEQAENATRTQFGLPSRPTH